MIGRWVVLRKVPSGSESIATKISIQTLEPGYKRTIPLCVCVCDQNEYANQVKSIPITKEHRKEKNSEVMGKERKMLRGVVGAANWLVGNTRPDIATMPAFLPQCIQWAQVSDLIEANKLVSKLCDHAHTTVTFRCIDLND